MPSYDIPFWKEAPFIRITIPFIGGILLAHYTGITINTLLTVAGIASLAVTFFYLLPLKRQFQFQFINGFLITIMFVSAGGVVASLKNPLAVEQFSADTVFVASVEEPPIEKKSSWKALATLDSTDIIIYFRKDSVVRPPPYGSTIIFRKHPQRIKNFIEGSDFDYQRYCALKNIHYQVFLSSSEYVVCDTSASNALYQFLFDARTWVIGTLQKYIPGKKEYGLAEALLIGYKNDLENGLIASYSNTGVVHVVAISGLHLGLIYALLNAACTRLTANRAGIVIKLVVILSGLWLFSLLAGASPSVLRSAVMFTFIVIGESMSRKTSLLNSLSASALFLLIVDPYWLWDLGFILSYAALLSIMLFMKPVYHLYIPHNKLIDHVWKLNAVTLAAQILTMPVLVYNFHQFPTLFPLTNMVAIPLSSIILMGGIMLCSLSFLAPVAELIGRILSKLIMWMNGVVEYADSFPFSSVKGLNINFIQLILLYIFIAWVFLVVLQPFKATR